MLIYPDNRRKKSFGKTRKNNEERAKTREAELETRSSGSQRATACKRRAKSEGKRIQCACEAEAMKGEGMTHWLVGGE
jgi:hypothetical protein